MLRNVGITDLFTHKWKGSTVWYKPHTAAGFREKMNAIHFILLMLNVTAADASWGFIFDRLEIKQMNRWKMTNSQHE